MAYTAYRFVPLTDPGNPDVQYPGLEQQARRAALFVDAYGRKSISVGDVVDGIIARLTELVGFIVDSAAAGDPAQRAVLERGDTKIYECDIAYLRQVRKELLNRAGE
jgi:hypothetical protein